MGSPLLMISVVVVTDVTLELLHQNGNPFGALQMQGNKLTCW